MGPVEIGALSIVLVVALIYAGLYVPVALGVVSVLGVWLMRDRIDLAINLLTLAVGDSVADYNFATIPLFMMMGLIVSRVGIGRDVYDVANDTFRRVRGGLGIATVAANALFASVTGSSIASASVFTRVSLPEMRRLAYGKRFCVGVVAGSSVLGMLIPPSVMMIIYAFVAEQSVGHMFLAGVIPGVLLAVAFAVGIVAMAHLAPRFVGGTLPDDTAPRLGLREKARMLGPVVLLVLAVLGGIYGGVVTATEAGALGALGALGIGLWRRRLSRSSLWEVFVETGYVSATLLFLIITANMYSRMLGVAGLPTLFSEWLAGMKFGLGELMALYVLVLIVLGTVLDTASIILIAAPLFMPAVVAFGGDLVWFGVVTVIGAEIGLLTPPLGLSVFTVKSAINDPTISLGDIFTGALPFATIMLLVLVIVIAFPALSLALI
ncbi:MAG: TRAP transporter large permease [Betaproteobacteria bacterium]|nr:TRAP transporter large permease [Betaproteobacteria bacterium]